jgi:cyclase
MKKMPTSKYFRLEQLADGVYAAIVHDGTGALGNAAFVDLGDRTLVFDTFRSFVAASDLRQAAEEMTGKPVSLVVNSHWHNDHVLGNQVFRDAVIISTAKTRLLMMERVSAFLEMAKAHPDYPQMLRKQLSESMEEPFRRELEANIGDVEHVAAHIHQYELTLPNLCFDHQLTIHGSRRTVELRCLGGGHTESDVFMYLPKERIAIMGDLISAGYHPMLKHGNPFEWIQILEQVSKLDIDVLVPGHGGVSTKEHIPCVQNYLETLLSLAEERLKQGYQESAPSVEIPEQYRSWLAPSVFGTNMEFLCELLTSRAKQVSGKENASPQG